MFQTILGKLEAEYFPTLWESSFLYVREGILIIIIVFAKYYFKGILLDPFNVLRVLFWQGHSTQKLADKRVCKSQPELIYFKKLEASQEP